jgi:hypothetical protein
MGTLIPHRLPQLLRTRSPLAPTRPLIIPSHPQPPPAAPPAAPPPWGQGAEPPPALPDSWIHAIGRLMPEEDLCGRTEWAGRARERPCEQGLPQALARSLRSLALL